MEDEDFNCDDIMERKFDAYRERKKERKYEDK